MKLGFEEEQSPYESGSQSARAWTERWLNDWGFCPNCGASTIQKFPANKPVADFYCSSCSEEYELKSQKSIFGSRVVDGAYKTMCDRLNAKNNPNLFLLRYNLKALCVTDLFVVPKHFFVEDIIEKRKPLSSTARRAGWVGCNILLNKIPATGKIYIVRDSTLVTREFVQQQWQQTLFLKHTSGRARGWLIETMKCIEAIGKPDFTLDEVYAFEASLGVLYPDNQHVREKIRQQMQVLRDQGYLDFLGRGRYRLQFAQPPCLED